MISIQTNVDSLNAQNNLTTNRSLQSKTIQQLTSGYRINSSGDDAAGLAIANGYRSSVNELTQGVSNANDGVSQLQIVDGGLSNISTILDRMKTLATQSASGTFTGNRDVLNQEYQGLVTEINRQAANINLNAGGSLNTKLNVYIGGGSNTANAGVTIDLSGTKNAVDATSLGLSGTSLSSSGTSLGSNALNITTGGSFVKGTTGTNDQQFQFQVINSSGAATQVTATIAATTNGSSLDQVLGSLNSQLNQYGITAGTDANGSLQFSGSTAFTVKDLGLQGSGGSNAVTDYGSNASAAGAKEGANGSSYSYDASSFQALSAAGHTDSLTFTTASGANINVNLTGASGSGDTLANAIASINSKTAAYGIYAVQDAAGTGISFQSQSNFSIADNNSTAGEGVLNNSTTGAIANPIAANAPSNSGDGTSAIAAINSAIQALGLVQGSVGAGENKLQYAVNLAQSQISNFSAAESQIRDADVATDASNLTKSQVLVQTSIAAMAQANSEPQSVLKLLQG